MDKATCLLVGVCLGLSITLFIAYLDHRSHHHRKRKRTPPRTHKRTTTPRTSTRAKVVPITQLMRLWARAGTAVLWAGPAATPHLAPGGRPGPSPTPGAPRAAAPGAATRTEDWPSQQVVRAEVQRLQDHLAVASEMIEHLGYGPTLEKILAELG